MDLPTVLSPPSRIGVPSLRLAFASDERLARLVSERNEAAFRFLYDRYHQSLYRYCRSLVGNEADAQDALQSTFTSAFTALRRGQRRAPVRPWLFRIAHNEAISLVRRRPPEQELSELMEPSTATLEERVVEREELALLVTDLRELPERQSSALVMREVSGLSHEEIAVALETSVNAAKQTIFEARRSLGEFAEGRAMACDEVCRMISDADGRMLRSRRVRAHLRHCGACATFAAAIPERRAQLRALAPPIPALAAGGILARVLGGGSAHGGGGGAGFLTAGASKAVGTALTAKVATVTAVAVTAVGVTAAIKQRMPVPHSTTTEAPVAGTVHGGAAAGGANFVQDPVGQILLSRPRTGRLVAVARHHTRRGAVARVVVAGNAATSTALKSLSPLSSAKAHTGSHGVGQSGAGLSSAGGNGSALANHTGSAHNSGSSTAVGAGTSHGSSSSQNAGGSSAGNATGGTGKRPAHPSAPPTPVHPHTGGTAAHKPVATGTAAASTSSP
jgi:RNA polymerase sigma factor (sigma-70 family)